MRALPAAAKAGEEDNARRATVRACHAAAVRTLGSCAACGAHRLLPGIDGAGHRLCSPCAGIDEDFTCPRCGTEWNLVNGICEWCQLTDVLDELLVGDVDLQALRARLLQAALPDPIIWLYALHARDLLRGLASGALPLTHAGPDAFENRRAADHVRGLLVAGRRLKNGLSEPRRGPKRVPDV